MATSNEEGLELGELFSVPEEGPGDPRPIVAQLVDAVDEFSSLKMGEAVIMVLFRNFEKEKQERTVVGTMALPEAQGAMREMFHLAADQHVRWARCRILF